METIALIELLDRDGQVRHIVRVTQWPMRIGRGIDCDVVLDDPHVAGHHASLVERDGVVYLEPEPSINGVHIGRHRLAPLAPRALDGATILTLGTTPIRLRFANEALMPEAPLRGPQHARGWRAAWTLALVLVAAAWAAFEQWLGATPGTSGSQFASVFLGAPLALGVWCGLWALGSKLFQRQFAFWAHLEVALFWPLLAMASVSLGEHLAFALSQPWLATAGRAGAVAALAMLLWRHLAIVLPQRRRGFAWVMAGIFCMGFGLDVAERHLHEQPLAGSLYLSALSLPQTRVARPVAVDAFVQSARPMEKQLARWAKSNGDDSEEDSSDGDD